MKILRALITALCLPGMVWANAADMARDAAQQLSDAALQLSAAETAGDRIGALTETIRAYETGLSAMRDGLRQVALRERALTADLLARDQDVASLAALLQTASRFNESQVLLHPGSAAETIRAGTLAAMLVPSLHQQAAQLEDDLIELNMLADLQTSGLKAIETGVEDVRQARFDLAAALSARAPLPPRLSDDQAAMVALVDSAETLSAFADSFLSAEAPANDLVGRMWPMPVKGQLLQGFNELGADGRRRPGWVIAATPEALVAAPTDATVRFSGEIPGQGTVTILEPTGGALVILAGMGKSFVKMDQIVAKNEPIGFMSRSSGRAQEKLNTSFTETGHFGSETLYMEIRQKQRPIDPADLLTLGQE